MQQVGGGKKNKGKKQKQPANKGDQYEAEIFTMDIITIQKFGLIGVSPPTNPDELEKKQKEIEDKIKWYEDNGKSALDDQIKEMQRARALQEERDAELERKRLQAQKEEEQKEEAYRGNRRGRGRGGRGGYGNRAAQDDEYRRVGAGRGTRVDAYRQKSEFEAEDDDTVYQQPVRQI